MAQDDQGCICGYSSWDVGCCIPMRVYWLTNYIVCGVLSGLYTVVSYPCSGDDKKD